MDESLDYLSTNKGIINHKFVQDKDKTNINCYLCGEKNEIHLGYIQDNKSEIKSENTITLYNIKANLKSETNSLKTTKFCNVCEDEFISNENNTVRNCGHSFCDDCWYNFLSANIEKNRISRIKCLQHDCDEKISDEFIINLLKSNEDLIKKYKKFKLELEVMNDPNRKLCPFPNCDSYLELKEKNNKYVKCLNNHSYCFVCLKEPHGKKKCDLSSSENSSMKEFAKNHFIKKCPNCGIITEKYSGCNHIICYKCNYQWCWLCNEKYTEDHYEEGKCGGLQFYEPENENEIKLALEGKIPIEDIQRNNRHHDLEELRYIMERINEVRNRHINGHRNFSDRDSESESGREMRIRRRNNEEIEIEKYDCLHSILIFLKYLFFGNLICSIHFFNLDFEIKPKFLILFIYFIYFLMGISLFFVNCYINIIMLLPYLINEGFYRFIFEFNRFKNERASRNIRFIIFKTIICLFYIFFGGFIYNLIIMRELKRERDTLLKIIRIFCSFFLCLAYYPVQVDISISLFIFRAIIEYDFFSVLRNDLNNIFYR